MDLQPRFTNVFFERYPDAGAAPGLLGRIARESCSFRVFHVPADARLIQTAILEYVLRSDGSKPLWMFTPEHPPKGVLAAYLLRRRRGWPAGVYSAPKHAGWNLVVVADLPRTRETLTVRLAGTGQTLLRALHDLRELPADAPELNAGRAVIDVLRSFDGPLDEPIERAIRAEAREMHALLQRRENSPPG